jgi:pimeloyl-ACP methyl ester carboxylesterase
LCSTTLQLTYPGNLFINWIPSLYLSALYQTGIHSGFLIRSIFGAACGPRCRPLSDKTLAEIQRPLEVAGAQDALFAFAQRPIVGVTLPQLKRLRSYRIPSAVIFGSSDSEFSLRSAYQTAMRIGAPSPTIIQGAGHLSMWSNPVQVANAIERFVTGLARP